MLSCDGSRATQYPRAMCQQGISSLRGRVMKHLVIENVGKALGIGDWIVEGAGRRRRMCGTVAQR